MVAGGACIGCTMPGFPDKYSPFYKTAPGSAVSGTLTKINGAGIRRLRRLSMKAGNRAPLWDNAEEVPSSGWGDVKGKPGAVDKANNFFYKKLQYHGSVHQGKRNHKQPLPGSRDILRKKGINPNQSTGVLRERVQAREEL